VTRHARRTDANHSDVRDGLRKAGYDVLDLSDCGNGVPDLVVSRKDFRLPPVFLEVKDGKKPPSARKLTEAEEKWLRYCGEITHTVTSLEEALEVLNEGQAPKEKKTNPNEPLEERITDASR
jgi:hypothetical protein